MISKIVLKAPSPSVSIDLLTEVRATTPTAAVAALTNSVQLPPAAIPAPYPTTALMQAYARRLGIGCCSALSKKNALPNAAPTAASALIQAATTNAAATT